MLFLLICIMTSKELDLTISVEGPEEHLIQYMDAINKAVKDTFKKLHSNNEKEVKLK